MNGKQRLECVLNGTAPDVPPHWELGFQLEQDMFGLDEYGRMCEDATGRAPGASQ